MVSASPSPDPRRDFTTVGVAHDLRSFLMADPTFPFWPFGKCASRQVVNSHPGNVFSL